MHVESVPPVLTFVHVPIDPATLHALQSAVHVLLQQTPSTQNPLTHSALAVHVTPFGTWQAPMPSHCSPVALHILSCCPDCTFEHVPKLPGTLQDWQEAVQG